MVSSPQLSPWQVLRTRLHLFLVAVRKRQTIGARMALIEGRRVLLVRHTYLPGWHFPGGGVEPFETAEAAAMREAEEEVGYRIGGRPTLHGLFLNRVAGGGRDYVALYVTRQFEATRVFVPNIEIAQCEWFEATALPAQTEAGTVRRVAEIMAATVPPSEW